MKKFGEGQQPFHAIIDIPEGDSQELTTVTDQALNSLYGELFNLLQTHGINPTTTTNADLKQVARAVWSASNAGCLFIDSGTDNIKNLTHSKGKDFLFKTSNANYDGFVIEFVNKVANTADVYINVFDAEQSINHFSSIPLVDNDGNPIAAGKLQKNTFVKAYYSKSINKFICVALLNVSLNDDSIFNSEGLSLRDTLVQKIESINDLETLKKINGRTVLVKSYHAGFNKGGGFFIFDSTKENINNKITVINGWVRQFETLSASDAGCREGDFENTELLNNLISVASETKTAIILDGVYKIGKLEKGITTTRFGDEPMWWLLKAKSNVTISGRAKSDGLFVAGGLVASNAAEANTKGYCVFGDGNLSDITNFSLANFTINNNGQNNLLQQINNYGSQSLCPNVWFQRGKNINIDNVDFIDNAGHQTIVFDMWTSNVSIKNCEFVNNGAGLDNNVHINDHSTIYCRANGYTITNNKFIITDDRQPDINTALELHGLNGDVYGNSTVGYPFAVIRASYDGQISRSVKIHDNTFENCTKICEFDGSDGSTLIVDFYDNIAFMRALKPSAGRVNVAFGHNQYSFPTIKSQNNNYIEINIKRNKVIQLDPKTDWTTYNHSDNLIFSGGKYNGVNIIDNEFTNFSSGYSIDYNNNLANYFIKNKLIRCGFKFDSGRGAINAALRIQNIDTAWESQQVNYVEILDEMQDCLFDAIVANLNPKTAKNSIYKIRTNGWIIPSIGYGHDTAITSNFDYIVANIGTNDIGNNGNKIFGKITTIDGNYFFKKYGTNKKWNMYREYDAVTAPVSPRVFGDIIGDIVVTTNPIAGKPLEYVCTASGADANTLGTWKQANIVQS